MTRSALMELVTTCFREVSPATRKLAAIEENTAIFGKNGTLDSMQLVSFLMELEQQINERFGVSISIADDRAVSQQKSPFRTVGDLLDYVSMLMKEQNITS